MCTYSTQCSGCTIMQHHFRAVLEQDWATLCMMTSQNKPIMNRAPELKASMNFVNKTKRLDQIATLKRSHDPDDKGTAPMRLLENNIVTYEPSIWRR